MMKTIKYISKPNILFTLPILIILFCGVNVLYTLGLKDPNNLSNKFIDNVNWGIIWICFASLIYIFQRKVKDYKAELFFILYFCAYYLFYKYALEKPASLTYISNAFLGPSLTYIYLKKYPNSNKLILRLLLSYFLIECSISIIERVLMTNFFITPGEGSVDSLASSDATGFRSAPIHGHSLQGALHVSVLMSFIYVSKIKFKYKTSLLLLGFVAILGYNTRSSIVYWSALICIFFLRKLFSTKNTTKEKFNIIIILLIIFFMSSLFISSGWGGRLFELSLFDQSSAAVRIDLFYMFKFLSWHDILFGIPLESIEHLKFKSGIAIIENYWVIFIFSFGLINTIIFVILTSWCLSPLFKNYNIFQKGVTIGTFLLISSTNNSMATNTPVMVILVLCAYAFPIYNKKIKRNDTQKNSLLLVRKKTSTQTSTKMY